MGDKGSREDSGSMFLCFRNMSKNSYNMILCTGAGLLIVLGLFTLTPMVIFGQKTALINRYYASRTLHLHKMTSSAVIPTQWTSLGLMHAFTEVNSMATDIFPAMYLISTGYQPDKESDNMVKCFTKSYKDDDGNSQDYEGYNFPAPLRCILEMSGNYVLYVNAATLSLLSHISPAVYLSTLVVIYQLSLVYFIFGVIFNRSEAEVSHGQKGQASDHTGMRRAAHEFSSRAYKEGGQIHGKWWSTVRNFCCYCVLAWYGLFLAVAVLEPSTQTVDWGPAAAQQTVEYQLNSNICSVIYCVIVLVVYYKRASREYPYWEYLFPRDHFIAYADLIGKEDHFDPDARYEDNEREIREIRGIPYDQNNKREFPGTPSAPDMYDSDNYMMKSNFNYPRVPVYNQYAAGQGSFNPVMTHSMHMPTLQMPGQTEWTGKRQGVLLDQAGAVTRKWNTQESAGSKHHKNFIFGGHRELGPVSNETSTIVSLTVFLGGIANLGMARGVLLETEAQFVIICLFAFVVLEFGRTHLFSYFWYLSVHVLETQFHENDNNLNGFVFYQKRDGIENCELFSHTKMIQVILIFVDVVVFLLQLIIVIMWQMTMETLLIYSDDPLRIFLILVVSFFLIVRTFSVFYGFFELYRLFSYKQNSGENVQEYMSEKIRNMHKYGKQVSMGVWQMEKYLYLLTVWLMIVGVLALSVTTDATKPSAEVRLRFAEKVNYRAASKLNPNVACSKGTQMNSLLAKVLTDSCDEKSVMQEDGDVDPVDMKVFVWSRWWQMVNKPVVMSKQDVCSKRDCQEYDALFCSVGFEQHWGQCKDEYLDYHGHVPRDNWSARILDNVYAYLGTSSVKTIPQDGSGIGLALPGGNLLSLLPHHHDVVNGVVVHTLQP